MAVDLFAAWNEFQRLEENARNFPLRILLTKRLRLETAGLKVDVGRIAPEHGIAFRLCAARDFSADRREDLRCAKAWNQQTEESGVPGYARADVGARAGAGRMSLP